MTMETTNPLPADFPSDSEKDLSMFALKKLQEFASETRLIYQGLMEEKAKYFQPIGRLKDSDPYYAHRINAFLNYFLFDCPLSKNKKSTLQLYIDHLQQKKSKIEIAFFSQLQKSSSAIFEFLKDKDESTLVRNLFTKEKIMVCRSDMLYGLNKGDLFETRMFLINKKYYFSNYFILQPLQVKKEIRKKIKIFQKEKVGEVRFRELLYFLQICRYKWDTYQHINIESIYQFETLSSGKK